MGDERVTPERRRGWTWTLIKCGAAVVASALAGGAALFALLRHLLGRLPDWLPEPWAEWVFTWMLRHVWFVGPILGALFGLVVSAGIVVYDARRGRLTRVR